MSNLAKYLSTIMKCLWALLLFSLTMCSNPIKSLKLGYEVMDTVIIHNSHSAMGTFKTHYYLETDSFDILAWLDYRNKRTVFLYNWENGELVKEISTEKEGDNGVGNILGFYMDTQDSLFVLDDYRYTLSVIRPDGEMSRSYKLIEGSTSKDTALPTVDSDVGIYRIKDKLIIRSLADVSDFESNYSKSMNAILLDLISGEFEYILGFPDSYKDNYWGLFHQVVAFAPVDDRILLVNYPIENVLYTYDLEKREIIDFYDANSHYIDDAVPPMGNYTNETRLVMRYSYSNDQYFSIIRDPYRNRYYRYFEQKYPPESVNKLVNMQSADLIGGRGLVILDAEFNKIGDILLPNGLSVRNVVITPKGVYFKHPKLSTNDESIFIGLNFHYED